MQTSTEPQPAPAPAAPAGRVSITTVGPGGTTQTLKIPSTQAEVGELLEQRRQLSDQIIDVTARRRALSAEIGNAPEGASRQGLEDRLRVLDQRILQLESDLAITGRQVALAPGDMVAFAERISRPNSQDDFAEGMAAGVFSTTLFLAVVYAFRRWRRRKPPGARNQIAAESSPRLERMEQGMEAIAIEIERISEGQRFVTKLLAESQGPVGAKQTIAKPALSEGDHTT